MKRIICTEKSAKIAAVLCVLCAVIWTAKLVVLLVLHPVSRDALDWTIEIICAVVWWVAALVSINRYRRRYLK